MDAPRKDLNKTKRAWTYSLVVWLVLVLYLAPVLLARNLWDPLDALPYVVCLAVGAGASLIGGVTWVKLLGRELRGWLAVFVLAWVPLLAVGFGLGGNVLLDTSPSQAHATTFLGYSHSQKGPSRARFSSWREAGGEEWVPCNLARRESLCIDFQRSPAVTISTRRGAFGWEWVESVRARAAE